jgi:CheY-like chemotaxis protein
MRQTLFALSDVLVVEDDTDLRDAYRAILSRAGYNVLTACDGQEALEVLEAGIRPRLILLDLMMPVMNGYEFRAAQRMRPELAKIPTVLLTAEPGADETARRLGCVGALHKPVQWGRLAEQVQGTLAAGLESLH